MTIEPDPHGDTQIPGPHFGSLPSMCPNPYSGFRRHEHVKSGSRMAFRGNLGFSLYAVCGVPCGFLCLCPAPRAPLPPKQLTGASGVLSALGWREEGECFHHKQGRSGITQVHRGLHSTPKGRLPGLPERTVNGLHCSATLWKRRLKSPSAQRGRF